MLWEKLNSDAWNNKQDETVLLQVALMLLIRPLGNIPGCPKRNIKGTCCEIVWITNLKKNLKGSPPFNGQKRKDKVFPSPGLFLCGWIKHNTCLSFMHVNLVYGLQQQQNHYHNTPCTLVKVYNEYFILIACVVRWIQIFSKLSFLPI